MLDGGATTTTSSGAVMPKTRRLSKKNQAVFLRLVREGLTDRGARKVTPRWAGDEQWSVDTRYGLLHLHPIDTAAFLYTVFGRFSDLTKSRVFSEANPHSGKWNFHDALNTSEDTAEYFLREIDRVL